MSPAESGGGVRVIYGWKEGFNDNELIVNQSGLVGDGRPPLLYTRLLRSASD